MQPTHRVATNVCSLFNQPDGEAELISQLIWGAPVEFRELSGEFCKVVGEDRYSGWVRSSQLAPIKDDSDSGISTIASLFAEVFRKPDNSSDMITRLTVSARVVLSNLPNVDGFVPIVLYSGGTGYIHRSQITLTADTRHDRQLSSLGTKNPQDVIFAGLKIEIAKVSRFFIGVPYLWGGTTPFGLDCSGFTQLVYKTNGVQLLRDSGLQWTDRRFSEVALSEGGLASNRLQGADLLFFARPETSPKITHVGLALGDGRFVHSVGKGRGNTISRCTDPEFARTFVGARRLNGSTNLSIEFAV
jgi:gamma-D-glutamyl-L-lysine dipeptidyl-peptidase